MADTWYPLAALAERINKTSTAHGFWPEDRTQALQAISRIIAILPEHNDDHVEHFGPLDDARLVRQYIEAQDIRNMGEMLMLATSELAEALEEHRDGNPIAEWRCKACGRGTGNIDVRELPNDCGRDCKHHYGPDPEGDYCLINDAMKPEGVLVELLDCIIRCLDTSLGVVRDAGEDPSFIDHVGDVKMDFNDNRPYKHGRAY